MVRDLLRERFRSQCRRVVRTRSEYCRCSVRHELQNQKCLPLQLQELSLSTCVAGFVKMQPRETGSIWDPLWKPDTCSAIHLLSICCQASPIPYSPAHRNATEWYPANLRRV